MSLDGQDCSRSALNLVLERYLFGVFEAARSDTGLEVPPLGVEPLETFAVSQPLLEVESVV